MSPNDKCHKLSVGFLCVYVWALLVVCCRSFSVDHLYSWTKEFGSRMLSPNGWCAVLLCTVQHADAKPLHCD
jgi:hypothetical protein